MISFIDYSRVCVCVNWQRKEQELKKMSPQLSSGIEFCVTISIYGHFGGWWWEALKKMKETVNFTVNSTILPPMTLKNLQIVADVGSHAHSKWRASSPICCFFGARWRCLRARYTLGWCTRLNFKINRAQRWILQTSLDFQYLTRQLTLISA